MDDLFNSRNRDQIIYRFGRYGAAPVFVERLLRADLPIRTEVAVRVT